jgi:choline dehydrogenase
LSQPEILPTCADEGIRTIVYSPLARGRLARLARPFPKGLHLKSYFAQYPGDLGEHFDFIVCGAGSSGSVVASRLAENPLVTVLLLEAGATDEVAEVDNPSKWPFNLHGERDWAFPSVPNPNLLGRRTDLAAGKVLGGGSSINTLVWMQGHERDWDSLSQQVHDPRWNYASIRDIYQRVEDWQGPSEKQGRGSGGPMHIESVIEPSPISSAMLEAAELAGIPRFGSFNGPLRQAVSGCCFTEVIVREGERRSAYRSYIGRKDQPNLTVVTGALVTRVVFSGKRAEGVDVLLAGQSLRFSARIETIISLGAIHTPKLLMQSGIGDPEELIRHSIPVKQALPGVGKNLQDHAAVDLLWEYQGEPILRNNLAEALLTWSSDLDAGAPDLLVACVELDRVSAELQQLRDNSAPCWGLKMGLLSPRSRGKISLTGPGYEDPVAVDTGYLSHPDDLRTLRAGVELCRKIGNSAPLAAFAKREVFPADKIDVEKLIRLGLNSFFHPTCTARMGEDELSVVDNQLRVHGVEGLRIADGSVLIEITRATTMGPCVAIGERAAALVKTQHRI